MSGISSLKHAFRDFVVDGVPSSGPNEPDKAEIRAGFDRLGADIASVADNIQPFASWADLSAVTGSAGDSAVIYEDAGTHADPVVGGIVDNTGIYLWSTSPAGWERIADTEALRAKEYADAAEAAASLLTTDEPDNIAGFGPLSLGNLTTATGVTAVGSQAARGLTSGANNSFFGYAAGRAMTTGSGNTGIGVGAFLNATAAINSVAIGEFALGAATANGARNVAIGNDALADYTGDEATAVGFNALKDATGSHNTAIGVSAGSSVTNGARNVFVGRNAGVAGGTHNGSANDTIVIGHGAGALGSGQIVLGTNAQKEMMLFGNPWARQFANFDTVIGNGAGNSSTNGGGRVIIGYQAGVSMDTADDESTVVIGYVAGNLAEQFRYSVAIGDRAAQFAFNCIDCTMVGSQAGRNLGRLEPYEYDSDDEDHILAAGSDVTHGGSLPVPGLVGATFMGKNAGRYNTIGLNNTGFGDSALGYTTVGGQNVAVGYVCGEGNVIGSRNAFVGQGIRLRIYSGDDNVAVGYGIGSNLGAHGDWRAGGHRNANIGAAAAYIWGGSDTVSVGYRTFYSLSAGDGGDVAIGARAGGALVTGGRNIFIGQDAGQGGGQATNVQNSIAIGADVVTTVSNEIVIGNDDHGEITIMGETFTKAQIAALLALVTP